MAEIEFKDVTKRYGDGYEAVKHINLDVKDGELMVLVGPSGCGKSTALRMVAGLEDISDGELKIGGTVVNDRAPKDRDIAMVFQNYALYPHMTVRENMGFALKLAKVPQEEIDKKVNDAAKILDLEQHLDRKPANLSGGQRQRVAMGRAIVRDPSVFLMDEPLSNLDAKLRVQMRTEISRIQQRLKTTMIYVTHDQTEAMTLGDRIAVMRAGVLQQVGAPSELYGQPEEPVRRRLRRLAVDELPPRRDSRATVHAADRRRAAAGELRRSSRPDRAGVARSDRGAAARGLRGRQPGQRQVSRHHIQDAGSTCSSRWARSTTPTSWSSPSGSPRASSRSWLRMRAQRPPPFPRRQPSGGPTRGRQQGQARRGAGAVVQHLASAPVRSRERTEPAGERRRLRISEPAAAPGR